MLIHFKLYSSELKSCSLVAKEASVNKISASQIGKATVGSCCWPGL